MTKRKLTEKQIKNIQKLLEEGYRPKDLAKKYGVHISVIYRRAKYAYQSIINIFGGFNGLERVLD